MENDDKLIGKILSRRDALRVLGVGTAAFLAGCSSPEGTSTLVPTTESTQVSATPIAPTASAALDCVVRPEMTIGPYFVDEQLNRSDIRSDSSDNSVMEGVPLTLNIVVASVGENSCTPSKARRWISGTVMHRANIPVFPIRDLTPRSMISCAVISSPMQMVGLSSRRSSRAGTPAGLCISTLRSAHRELRVMATNSLPNSSLMIR